MATESDLMAECMDETRRIMISAGIIDQSVPPMFVAEAVIAAARVAAARIDALEVDAERYRFLRDNNGVANHHGVEVYIDGEAHAPGHLDAQVDTAIDQARGKGVADA